MNNMVIMHVNYGEMTYDTYGKKTVDDICKMAAELGFDGIEFRETPPVEYRQANIDFLDYVKEIAAGKKKYGLKEILFCIGDRNCVDPDKEVRAAGVAEAVKRAQIVNDLCGTTTCNTDSSVIHSKIPTAPSASYEFHGSAAATEEDWKLTADAFHMIGEGIEPLGMKFGFETHMNYIHDLPHATMKLVNMIDSPAIGINMDFGNQVYFPTYPSLTETIDIYGDKLFYTHLKNSTPTGNGSRIGTNLSDGQINHRLYLDKLQEVGFTGPIGIEAPRDGDRYWFAQNDIAYVRSLMASL